MRTICIPILLLIVGCSTPAQARRPDPLVALSDSFRGLSTRISGSVVQILATGYAPLDHGGIGRRRSTGSGAIVSKEGLIITNAHVVQGARRVEVRLDANLTMPGGKSIVKPSARLIQAKIVGIDLETDLALLSIKPPVPLTPIPFGDSDALEAGQVVLAFGSPLGLAGSVTMGVISAVGRQLHPEHPMVYVQTDAPINPGNSGGPLIDIEGKLIGINTLIISKSGGSEGLGFAAPSNIVQRVYAALRTDGHVTRGIIGVHAQTITPLIASGLGLDRTGGVIISDVYPGSPAMLAQLQRGDLILALNGRPMENARQFEVNVYHAKIGEMVNLRIVREGRVEDIEVGVIERPHRREQLASKLDPEKNLVHKLGLIGIDITPTIAQHLPTLRGAGGVLVAATSPDGHGLTTGDVIHKVNRANVNDLAGLNEALKKLGPGDAIVLEVERGGYFHLLSFQLD